jgi:hypothetical protein
MHHTYVVMLLGPAVNVDAACKLVAIASCAVHGSCNTVVGCDCRATFTLKSLEVRVVALQGKNYVYAVKSLFMPINVDGCHVAASNTKKNVLITLQVGFAPLPPMAVLAANGCALCLHLSVTPTVEARQVPLLDSAARWHTRCSRQVAH